MTVSHFAPIVGMHFRPPAKAVMQVLSQGANLILEREPDNAYDENAIKVLVSPSQISSEIYPTLEELAAPYGSTLEEILSSNAIHLGYIARDQAAILAPMLDQGAIPQTSLYYGADTKPQASMVWEDS